MSEVHAEPRMRQAIVVFPFSSRCGNCDGRIRPSQDRTCPSCRTRFCYLAAARNNQDVLLSYASYYFSLWPRLQFIGIPRKNADTDSTPQWGLAELFNPHYVINAFIRPNAVRLAKLLETLAPIGDEWLSRETIMNAWGQYYPEHTQQEKRRSVRARYFDGLRFLIASGIVTADSHGLSIRDGVLLHMAARNYDTVINEKGITISPHLWHQEPVVPVVLASLLRRIKHRKYKIDNL